MQITLTDVKPYDGTYTLDLAVPFTTREWGWIKRMSGYLPMTLDEGAIGGDPEFACVLTVIAMHRAKRIQTSEASALFDRLVDAPFGSALTLDAGPEDEATEEDDVGPPVQSSNGSGDFSGTGSRTSSETSAPPLSTSGTPDLAFSPSAQTMLER